MNPEWLLAQHNGQEVVRIGGFILPAEDFNLARFLRDDLGITWLHAGGMSSTRQLLEKLAIQPGTEVLDLGCGVGSTTRLLAREFDCQVLGLDNDPEMIRRAQAATPSRSFPRIRYAQADAARTGLVANRFDYVIVQSVACFISKPMLFREVARVLKPGGYVGVNEVTWLQPPNEKIERVMCSTVCETFHGALLAAQWLQVMREAGLGEATHEEYPFTAATPYRLLREEGPIKTARILWRALRDPETNMRLSAMSDLFRRSPEHFSYGLYTARKPASI
jgi:ubiquinone/menaquinone biosynthesis C-methylase UbiE